MKRAGIVSLIIYDLLGKEVTALVNEYKVRAMKTSHMDFHGKL